MKAERRRWRGFTLIELLVSIMIFGLVMSLVYTMFIKTKETERTEIDLTVARENARIAVDMMRRDIENMGLGVDREHGQPSFLYGDCWQIVFNADLDRDLDPDERLGPLRRELDRLFEDASGIRTKLLFGPRSMGGPSSTGGLGLLIPEAGIGQVGVGAETVRYSFDYFGSAFNREDNRENNLFQLTGLDRTFNPFDFYLLRERWGSRNVGGTPQNVYVGPEIVATNVRGWVATSGDVAYPNGQAYPRNGIQHFPYPMFTYWGHFWAADSEPDAGDPTWSGGQLDLWGDTNHNGRLEAEEIAALELDFWQGQLTWTPEPTPNPATPDDWSWDRNKNGIWDETLDDVVKRVVITVTTEVSEHNVRFPNPQRSLNSQPYPYYDVVQKASVALNLSQQQPYQPQATVFTPTPAPSATPTVPGGGTATPVGTTTPGPTATPFGSATPDTVPTATPTPTSLPVLPPPKLAEVAIASYNAPQSSDIVKAWAIDTAANKYSPPLTLLGVNPQPNPPVENPYSICGQVVGMAIGDLAKDLDNYRDLIVVTDQDCAGDGQDPQFNLYLFHNEAATAQRYGLQYNFQGRYFLEPSTPYDSFQIVKVATGDPDHDFQDEIIVAFNYVPHLGQATWGRIQVYETMNNGSADLDFELDTSSGNFPKTFFTLNSWPIIDFQLGNFYMRGSSEPYVNDDIVILTNPEQLNGRQLWLYASKNNGLEWSPPADWPQQPDEGQIPGELITKLEVGDVWTYVGQRASHPDLIVATASNTLRVFRNTYDTFIPYPGGDETLLLWDADEFGPDFDQPILAIKSGDMFGAADHDDIIVLLDEDEDDEFNVVTYEAAPGPSIIRRFRAHLPNYFDDLLPPPERIDIGHLWPFEYACMLVGMRGQLPSGMNATLILARNLPAPTPDPQATPAYALPRGPADTWDEDDSHPRIIRNSRGVLRWIEMTQMQEALDFPDDHVFTSRSQAQEQMRMLRQSAQQSQAGR
jgi:prepilin-type N-terminal cleavage/methylation domain-containing protein